MGELEQNGVEIYKFPTDDETVAEINNQMNVSSIFCSLQASWKFQFWQD